MLRGGEGRRRQHVFRVLDARVVWRCFGGFQLTFRRCSSMQRWDRQTRPNRLCHRLFKIVVSSRYFRSSERADGSVGRRILCSHCPHMVCPPFGARVWVWIWVTVWVWVWPLEIVVGLRPPPLWHRPAPRSRVETRSDFNMVPYKSARPDRGYGGWGMEDGGRIKDG